MEKLPQTVGSLRENLVRVPICRDHYVRNGHDIVVGHIFMKQVAHGIDENHLGIPPAQWLGKLFRDKAQIESLFVGMSLHSAKAFRKRLGVAVLTAIADLGAAPNGIPSCVCPFYI